MKAVYLDYNATTPVVPEVMDVMMPYFTQAFANASSRSHAMGWKSAAAIDEALHSLMDACGVSRPEEWIFTSGATEAINLAMRGVWAVYGGARKNILAVAATEHKAVLDTAYDLKTKGAQIIEIPVQADGRLDMEFLEKNVNEHWLMCCAMLANNETGCLLDVDRMRQFCKARDLIWLCDATQAWGKMPVSLADSGKELWVGSAHKFYGPKGIGFLYVKSGRFGIKLQPQITGGGHQHNLRSGTLPVPLIVGLAKAFEWCSKHWNTAQISQLAVELSARLEASGLFQANPIHRPQGHVLSMQCLTMPSGKLIPRIADTVALATGSACTSAQEAPSHVLKAMHYSDHRCRSTLRLSLGVFTSREEIAFAAEKLIAGAKHPLGQTH